MQALGYQIGPPAWAPSHYSFFQETRTASSVGSTEDSRPSCLSRYWNKIVKYMYRKSHIVLPIIVLAICIPVALATLVYVIRPTRTHLNAILQRAECLLDHGNLHFTCSGINLLMLFLLLIPTLLSLWHVWYLHTGKEAPYSLYSFFVPALRRGKQTHDVFKTTTRTFNVFSAHMPTIFAKFEINASYSPLSSLFLLLRQCICVAALGTQKSSI